MSHTGRAGRRWLKGTGLPPKGRKDTAEICNVLIFIGSFQEIEHEITQSAYSKLTPAARGLPMIPFGRHMS
jgi:hypothetical protein